MRRFRIEPKANFRDVYSGLDALKEHEITRIVEILGALSLTEEDLHDWNEDAGSLEPKHSLRAKVGEKCGLSITTDPRAPEVVSVKIYNDKLNGAYGYPDGMWFNAISTEDGLVITDGAILYTGKILSCSPLLKFHPNRKSSHSQKFEFMRNHHDEWKLPEFFRDVPSDKVTEKFLETAQMLLEKNNIDLHAEK